MIGGLAVTCRLAERHRATADVDVVTEDRDVVAASGSAVENVLAAGVANRMPNASPATIVVDGTKVEIIETAPLDEESAAAVEPERDRLFVLAHRWALDSAEQLRVGVIGTPFAAALPVATPSALIAMKLHAFEDRREPEKQASDAWDLYRLLEAYNRAGQMATAFARSPSGLSPIVLRAIRRVFVDDRTRTRNRVRDYGEPEWAGVMTEGVMRNLGEELIEALLPGVA